MTFKNKVFDNETVRLDHNEFDGCTFNNCTLVYGAHGPVSLTNNTINAPNWQFDGGAGATFSFLASLYAGGCAPIVEGIFQMIRQAATALQTPPVPPPNPATPVRTN